ncbi:anthocyanidin 3-O-glucosyltransferase 2-like [Ziziphus jujuba]|uniref:Glycosyltransferase n=1 Tax=Ziziphus jujuba TaxID=326968 RepID=A0ABM4A681_ZIZJJ|nr:anthocyanidin 3-O-glucosyltransferase 2-like [Ziziphus jujuba]
MKKAELVFIAYPGSGCIVSTVGIAKYLLTQHEHLFATVLVMKLPFHSTYDVVTYTQSLSSSSSSISKRINFIDLPQENTYADSIAADFLRQFLEDQKLHVKNAVAKLMDSRRSTCSDDSPRLTGFVVDVLCTTMIDVADEFGIPSYVFLTSGAGFLSLLFHLLQLHDEENVDPTQFKNDPTAELVVPGFLNRVPARVLPGVMLDKDLAPTMMGYARKIRGSKGIMVNTFMELESCAIRSLSDDDAKFPPVYPVGPILNLNAHPNIIGSDITKWLDDQPPSSVVFLCFGTIGSFSRDQVKEIAIALENSGVRFVWSLRKPPSKMAFAMPGNYADLEEILPKEFLDRTAEIGRIIGWAPQVDILSHQAVGGFVSHCGWNSTLKSLWFGVPIATLPLKSEQQLNAFELVKELGLGVEIKIDHRGCFYGGNEHSIVSAKEIELGIKRVMEVDSDTRKRVKEMSEKSRRALMDGGSSYSSLNDFIKTLMDGLP